VRRVAWQEDPLFGRRWVPWNERFSCPGYGALRPMLLCAIFLLVHRDHRFRIDYTKAGTVRR
jgi:hypothetical protein